MDVDVVLLIGVVALFVIALSDRLAEWAGLVAPVVLLVLGRGSRRSPPCRLCTPTPTSSFS